MGTKKRILEAAIRLYNEKGVRSVTARHIAESIGMSSGNLHYHYKYTEDIVIAAYEELASAYSDLLTRTEGRDSVSLNDMHQIFRESFKIITTYRFFFLHFVDIAQWIPEIQVAFSELMKEREKQIIGIIIKYTESNNLIIGVDDDQIMLLVRKVFIVSDFWLSYNFMTDRLSGLEAENSYLDVMMSLFQPYTGK